MEKEHTDDDCDKCHKRVGADKLRPLPFLYCDMNDKNHDDVSYMVGYPEGSGYRLYRVCSSCFKKEVRNSATQKKKK